MTAKIEEVQGNELLPAELDNARVIFSYGSLLEHKKLRDLLKNRGRFEVFETNNAADAAILVNAYPKDIVILKNVLLENVRVSIVTETILRRWYQKHGGNVQTLVDAGITTAEIPRALFLYARPAQPNEKGRTLKGGLICNLSNDELSMLDSYEWKPVLKRSRITKIRIENRIYFPEHITFYAGTESADNITLIEKAERAKFLNFNRNRGSLSPQAKWQKDVRS